MAKFLLITHAEIGIALINAAKQNLHKDDLSIDCISVNHNNLDISKSNLEKYMKNHDQSPLIVLTDLAGSSPSNLIKCYTKLSYVHAISGVNLAMLLKALTFKTNDVNVMIDELIKCGNKSIINFI